MTDEQLIQLLNQHTQMLINVERIYNVLVAFAFLFLFFILFMIFVAVWSVRSVGKRQKQTEDKWDLLVGKWDGLLNLLVANARRRD